MPLVFYPPNISDQYPISDPTGKFFDFTFCFFPFNLEDRFTSFGLVRNSRGLLLCKGELIMSRTSSPQSSHRQSEYYVCNPLTKQWLRIPKLDRRMSFKVDYVGFTCYALDTRLPHKVEFVVLEVEKKRWKKDEFFYTRVFSSLTGCWSVYCVACSPGPSWPSRESTGMYGTDYDTDLYDYGTIAVYKGMFHWNGGSCLIAYDPLNEPYKCSSIPIPEELAHNGSRVELSEGRI
ncbi:uncharacterized protein LOC110713377 [Chenopodium quinoa]|uniref:uncharacterized protein LOC110713377 n=1 Tax=Chenopodium quinoa TaxID=63459 RepID=UPI000B78011F|nr:uncharacterized protein LOC110713377 [Chenopodium quinoa]